MCAWCAHDMFELNNCLGWCRHILQEIQVSYSVLLNLQSYWSLTDGDLLYLPSKSLPKTTWLTHNDTQTLVYAKVPKSLFWTGLLTLPLVCPGLLPSTEMWCSRVALRRLQRIAVTPLNTAGGLTGAVQRQMSTLPRVYITRQIPPEGLKILRESGQ